MKGLYLIGAIAGATILLSRKASAKSATCYQQKSATYDLCRKIPPSDQGARQACFDAADKTLQACLAGGVKGFAGNLPIFTASPDGAFDQRYYFSR